MSDINQLLIDFVKTPEDPEINYQLGSYYEDLKQYSSAGSYYLRASERYEDLDLSYESLVRLAQCLISLGRRKYSTKGILNFAISMMPNRPEAYYVLSKFIEHNDDSEEKWFNARTLVTIALQVCNFDELSDFRKQTEYENRWSLIFQKAHTSRHSGFIEESRELFLSIIQGDAPEHVKNLARKNIMQLKKENSRAKFYHSESDLKDVYETSLAKYSIEHGGSIHPILLDESFVGKDSLMNGSVFVDGDDILLSVRKTSYVIYASRKFLEKPMYFNPEDDLNIRSENILCRLDESLNVKSADMVEMKPKFLPNWFYIGLEDPRVCVWNEKTYLSGVRRDELGEGKGRISLSEISTQEGNVKELNRYTIPAPQPDDSYCEKNWMPILDKPFHWIKWSNPTQVVRYDFEKKETVNVSLDENKIYNFPNHLKGSSQIVKWYEYYLGITHEVIFDENLNRYRYYHRIVVWDENWNIVCSTREFTMMSGCIEFVAGLAFYKDSVLISYGHEDHSAHVLKIPRNVFDDFVMRG